jgi:hypothetical protein
MNVELMRVRGEPIMLNPDGSLAFVAGMTIDADGGRRTYAPPDSGLRGLDYLSNAGYPGNWYGLVTNEKGTPYVAKSGYYVSPTTYERKQYARSNPERYLDPEMEFFVVFPGPMRRIVKPVILGCKVIVEDVLCGIFKEGVAGDSGPATHLGEASIMFAEHFGVPSSPKWGGTDAKRFRYTFFPGVAAEGYELQPLNA